MTEKNTPPKKPRRKAPQLHVEALKKLRIIIRTAQRHSSWIEKQCGVSGAQLWVMQELSDVPGLRVGELAERMVMHQTTVSNLLDSLEKRGLIAKKRDMADQRVVKLELTREGGQLLAEAPAPTRGLLPESLRRLEEEEIKALNHGLQALLDVIGADEEIQGLQPMPFNE